MDSRSEGSLDQKILELSSAIWGSIYREKRQQNKGARDNKQISSQV